MSSDPDVLLLDLLEWLSSQARPYAEVTEAWRTSRPRLPAWEKANAHGYINRQHLVGRGVMVSASALGRAVLRQHRPVQLTTTGAPYLPDMPGQTHGDQLGLRWESRKDGPT
jgi:hypothetical protein